MCVVIIGENNIKSSNKKGGVVLYCGLPFLTLCLSSVSQETIYLLGLYMLVYLCVCDAHPYVCVHGYERVCQGLAAARPAQPQTGSGPNLAGVGAIWVDRPLTSLSSSIYLFSSFLRPHPPAHPSPNHSWHVKRLLGPPPGLAHLATCLYLSDSRGTFIHPFIHPSLSFSLRIHAFFYTTYTQSRRNHSLGVSFIPDVCCRGNRD